MKHIRAVIFWIAIVCLVFLVAAATPLTELQVLIVGIIASVLTQVFVLIFKWFKWKPGQEAKVVLLWIVAIITGYVFLRPELPSGADPSEISMIVLNAAIGVVGVATTIYKLLLQKIVFPAFRMG